MGSAPGHEVQAESYAEPVFGLGHYGQQLPLYASLARAASSCQAHASPQTSVNPWALLAKVLTRSRDTARRSKAEDTLLGGTKASFPFKFCTPLGEFFDHKANTFHLNWLYLILQSV